MGRKKKEIKSSKIENIIPTTSKDIPETINPSFLEITQLDLIKSKIENYKLKIEMNNLDKKLQIIEMNNLINSIRKNHNISSKYIFDLKSNTFNIIPK